MSDAVTTTVEILNELRRMRRRRTGTVSIAVGVCLGLFLHYFAVGILIVFLTLFGALPNAWRLTERASDEMNSPAVLPENTGKPRDTDP